ncbi:hypothetical protein AGDE_16911 [Angomonas deanei]|uniref:Uncharacterized protein n=1 Tax=Angomonas deanei TaxID=59799 RepID=A0A7G2CN22_9TRYP|nr:hypothetical protein AGDE_16911 [Angomonas deanei]CAD2220835.1 hypothetical protein, conserved [Angomonas deanei]|eukprot:EPY15917.1 hypothetical protein AGDE_16911 [Angomonas deanei]
MFPFHHLSDYMDYFGGSPPLALSAVNSHGRECGECHQRGILGCTVATEGYETRRVIRMGSSDIGRAEHAQWWMERQRDYSLQTAVEFNGAESLGDIAGWVDLAHLLSESEVGHMFQLHVKEAESLLPFVALLHQSEGIHLYNYSLTSLQALEGLERLKKSRVAVV